MSVVDSSYDHPLKLEERASAPLAGGIMQYGYQCGMLWGAALATGARAYQLFGPGPQAETASIIASQRVVESFRGCTKNEINCLEITDLNMRGKTQITKIIKFFIKGGPIGCLRMITKYTPKAFGDINTALSEKHSEAPSPPVSCATILAQKMGASEMHAVMAAGLAGGIGLSGGGCGALGAAIWINEINSGKEGAGYKATNARASEIIDRFIRSRCIEFKTSHI